MQNGDGPGRLEPICLGADPPHAPFWRFDVTQPMAVFDPGAPMRDADRLTGHPVDVNIKQYVIWA